ncbi:MAG: tetratricopeptide repeat protein [Candidatus Thermochlorobacter sp.]
MNARLRGLEVMLRSLPDVQARVDLINQTAWDLRHTETENALMLSKDAEALAQGAGYTRGLAEALKIRGYCKWRKHDYNAALHDCNKALKIFQDLDDKANQIATLTTLGNIYYKIGDARKALEHYQKSLELSRAIGNSKSEATALNNIGGIYASVGEYRQALEYHQSSLRIRVAIRDRVGEANSLNHLAIIYGQLGDYKQSLSYHERSLKLRTVLGDKKGEAASLQSIAAIYYNAGNSEKALEYYERALKIKHELGDYQGEAYLLNSIGTVYASLGKYEQALEYHHRSLKCQEEAGDRQGEADTLLRIGKIFTKQQKLEKATEHIQRALRLSEEVKSKGVALEAKLQQSKLDELANAKTEAVSESDSAEHQSVSRAMPAVQAPSNPHEDNASLSVPLSVSILETQSDAQPISETSAETTAAHLSTQQAAIQSDGMSDDLNVSEGEHFGGAGETVKSETKPELSTQPLLSTESEPTLSSAAELATASEPESTATPALKRKRGRPTNVPAGIKPKKITYYLKNPTLEKQLKRLSVETERDLSDLTTEALEDLLKKYGFAP